MPTDVFMNLNKTKKERIVKIGLEVFSKNKYHKTSVKLITESLGITRTAFYYYFNGKDDFYKYLITLKKDEFVNKYIYANDEKIDLFELFSKLFEYLSTYKGTLQEAFFLDLFYNMDFDEQNTLLLQLIGRESYSEFSHLMGFDKYKMKSKDEVSEVVNILFAMVYHQMLYYYHSDISMMAAKENLDIKMGYLKYGILKEGK